MSKERDRINRLQHRLDHLNETLERSAFSNQVSYDRAEASALRWAIMVLELALSNWPSGIHAVREMEDRR